MKPNVATVYVDAFNLDAVRSTIGDLAAENARLTALATELAEALTFEMGFQGCRELPWSRSGDLLRRADVRVLLDREDQADE